MSTGVKLEVLWSPVHNDKFITWGTDVSLYEVVSLKDISEKPACIKLSENSGAYLVASNGNHHYVKCVDIYPQPGADLLLALGQANGKVVLTTFGPTTFDAMGINGKEFVPRHARQCNAVAWNKLDSNILASALDKYRNDHCILLWDVMKSPSSGDGSISPRLTSSLMSQYTYGVTPALEVARPLAEMGLSELAHSLAWLHRQQRTLVVGMNQKQIKIFDLRDFSNKAVITAATKAVYGVCVDPHNDYQLASRVDNIITIWDTRVFDKPVLTLNQAKAVTKILWCPTRPNLLGSSQRSVSVLHLADLRGLPGEDMSSSVGASETMGGDPPAALERSVCPRATSLALGDHSIASFSWHPQDTNRLIMFTMTGTLADYTVSERITLNWGSGAGPIVWSHGNTTLKVLDESFSSILDDISLKIKKRATTDYGLKVELWQNGELAEDDALKKLWHWLYLSRSLVEEGCIRGLNCKHPGVRSVLKLDSPDGTPGGPTGSYNLSLRADFGNMQHTIYRSEDRDRALQLCGWNFDKDSASLSLTSFLERLEADKAYTRAAAISVFNMKLRAAIDILNRGAEKNPTFSIISMALAGYSDTPGSVWRQLCSSNRASLTDPYIRAMFAFLTAESGSLDVVLNEVGMAVEDKVAFALTFLSDSKLSDYIGQISTKLIEEGNLSGILLSGSNMDGVTLLQQYLDITGDVQSVSLIAARAFQPELIREQQVQEWISSYRNLLDSWHFWSERALFDIRLNACTPSNKPPHQVYVSCNYCGKSISAYMQGLNRSKTSFPRIGATNNKIKQMSACPNCRKPLPRCSICLLHMGSTRPPLSALPPPLPPPGPPGVLPPPSPASPQPPSIGSLPGHAPKGSHFSGWFTWCQACRHGGHAQHLLSWFREHAECPVTSCTCRCFLIDSVSSHSFLQMCLS